MPISEDGKTYIPPGAQIREPISTVQHIGIIISSLFIGVMMGGVLCAGLTIVFVFTGGIGWMTSAPNEDIYTFIINAVGLSAAIITTIITYNLFRNRSSKNKRKPQSGR